jgi:hypothetical protein
VDSFPIWQLSLDPDLKADWRSAQSPWRQSLARRSTDPSDQYVEKYSSLKNKK